MQDSGRNIYQIARNHAGYTQEKASELIAVSVESLRAYEGGRTVPPNDAVCRMVTVYGTQHLAYQHLMASSEVARQVMPSVELRDIIEAMARLLKEVNDFVPYQQELLAITCDGVISSEERPRFDAIMKELDDIVAAVMAMKYAKERG